MVTLRAPHSSSPPHHSLSSRGRFERRPLICASCVSNMACMFWCCDSICPWSCCDCTFNCVCNEETFWFCWCENSLNWTSMLDCWCMSCCTCPSNTTNLSGTSSSIDWGILAITAAWILDSIWCMLSEAPGTQAEALVDGWNLLQGSCRDHGSSSFTAGPPPHKAKVAGEAIGLAGSTRSACSPGLCSEIRISPWFVYTMELGGSSTAWMSHMTPRPGWGLAGWSGLHCQFASFMARLIAWRSTPKGKGPAMNWVLAPCGRNRVSGRTTLWISCAWSACTLNPRRSPMRANPVTAGLVCLRCNSSRWESLPAQTTMYSWRTWVPSAFRGST